MLVLVIPHVPRFSMSFNVSTPSVGPTSYCHGLHACWYELVHPANDHMYMIRKHIRSPKPPPGDANTDPPAPRSTASRTRLVAVDIIISHLTKNSKI